MSDLRWNDVGAASTPMRAVPGASIENWQAGTTRIAAACLCLQEVQELMHNPKA
ncbi:hypothetical protein AB0K52_22045 [Glycomyces sp. NPDC049804]|uniref:hypothetical protein n=1 Tax=Glycomyces sp. NPDC049804 TaxID=3154363 RepID=UPI0034217510